MSLRNLLACVLVLASAAPAFAREDESVLLVLHANQPKVTVLDSERGRRIKTIQLERECVDFEIAADGRHLYLSNEGEARISVVDLAGKDPARSIELGGSGEARGLALSGPDLVVALSGAGQIVLVDVAKGVVKKRIDVRGRSLDRVVTAGNYGKTAYVSESTTGEVYVVDLERGSVVYTVPTGATAGSIAIDAPSGEVWVADRTLGQLRVVAAKAAQAVRTVECSGGPQRVVLGGGRVFRSVYRFGGHRGRARWLEDDRSTHPDPRRVRRCGHVRTRSHGAGTRRQACVPRRWQRTSHPRAGSRSARVP
jgi:DNA-binding beta-propeller fold protein YncE